MGQIGDLAPEIVAQHPHVTSECADLGHVVDGPHVEFNAAGFIAAGPGTKFTLYQALVDPQQELARSRHPRLSVASTGIYDGDRPCRKNAVMRFLPHLAFAGECELEKVKIGEYRYSDHHASTVLQRIKRDVADPGLTMAKIDTTLALQVRNVVLAQSTAQMRSPLLQITSAENGVTRE
jgi:hypothetical protein